MRKRLTRDVAVTLKTDVNPVIESVYLSVIGNGLSFLVCYLQYGVFGWHDLCLMF